MLIIETFISCDRCGENFGVDDKQKNAVQQRESARINGWKRLSGRDICSSCVQILKKNTTSK